MNPLSVNFQELYKRHLCRHSQYGINVIHLATVVGTYLALFGIIHSFFESWWMLLALPIPYCLALVFNIPLRVFMVIVAFMLCFFALFFSIPLLPIWLYIILIVLFYKIQAWSHKVYSVEEDMIEFNEKYRKGPALFVLLSLYELPILLNYLVFDRKNWSA
jgi:hypothetical protein